MNQKVRENLDQETLRLFETHDYAECIARIKGLSDNSEESTHLLANAFFKLQKFNEAAKEYKKLQTLNSDDKNRLACSLIELGNIDGARQIIKASGEAKKTACGYFISAIEVDEEERQIKGQNYYERKNQKLISRLNLAIKLPDCPKIVYLWRSNLYGYSDKDKDSRINLLNTARDLFPGSLIVDLTLAKALIVARRGAEALEAIQNHVDALNPSKKVILVAFEAALKSNNYQKAFEYLLKIESETTSPNIGWDKVKGDLYLNLGKYREAIECYDRELNRSDNREDKIVALFSKAHAYGLIGDKERLINLGSQAVNICFEDEDSLNSLLSFAPYIIELDGEQAYFDYGNCISDACEMLIKEMEGSGGNAQLLGKIHYILHLFNSQGSLDEHIERAHVLFPDPLITSELSECYYEANKYVEAIQSHLEASYWKWISKIEANSYDPADSELHFKENHRIPRKDLNDIHALLISKLTKEFDPKYMAAIIRPIYRSFWRPMLVNYRMFSEMRAAGAAMYEYDKNDAGIIFDIAYSANEINDKQTAETFYKHLLDIDPNETAALNNLSIIYEEQGKTPDALELAKKAAESQTDNQNYVNRYERLKKLVVHKRKDLKKINKRELTVIKKEQSSEKIISTELTKTLRFEVFKRDKFTCQYCGRQTPAVILEVDHVIPRNDGGTDDPNNLVTACFDCNRGKGATPISVQKLRENRAEEIQREQERRNQIEIYEQFLKEQKAREGEIIEALNDHWASLNEQAYILNAVGVEAIKRFLKFLSPSEIQEAMDIAAVRIPEISKIENRFKYFCGICNNKKMEKTGDTAGITLKKMERYYLSQRRGSGFYKKWKLKEFCSVYTEETIREAIDLAFSEGRPNYWDAFCEALEALTGESISS